ncbi:tubulin-specific chaperone cofactor E-like protein [Agrilus planipennis]|uniref:Tubulin-specific chaperone cofactor E-like protein n=1 Tax=Agrilus planipennis TaxID=224129 RepID=A0A1W4WX24_AGRPL|nr:tubulin-specific chaperone cofactor E-like protein [Agrilus planipennis]XP_018328404.1 tubulin-specific chaperone cofactor E-like protein [Agrilus planipennis]XP_018328405.1 tubulin-specific chaperone cofactor E-like protein [Agrilus planipennis]
MPSLLEALEQKYQDGGNATDTEGSVSIFVPRKPPRVIVPSLLVLNDCDITSAGDKQALVDKCAAVEELDLAKNKLEHWPEVLEILKHMPRLKFVNLSFNCLALPLNGQELDEQIRWQNLRNLVLNSTRVPWKNIQRILNHLPSLEELHLSLNDYNNVELYDETLHCDCDGEKPETETNENNVEKSSTVIDSEFNCNCGSPVEPKRKHKHLKVKKVHFTGNPVSKWHEICKIGYAFPNLESLVVAECPIKSLEVDYDVENCNKEKPQYERSESGYESDTKTPHDSFNKLKFLNLNATHLSTWDDVERLSKFPALHCLRVQVNTKFWYPDFTVSYN